MVDIRRDTGFAPELQLEPNWVNRYAANIAATISSAFGVIALIIMTSPNLAENARSVMFTSAPLGLYAPSEINEVAQISEDIVRTGTVTESVTALDVIEVLGADRQQADAALASLRRSELIGKDGVASGVSISVHLKPGEASEVGRDLMAITLRTDLGRSLISKRMNDGRYFSAELKSRVSLSHRRVAGILSSTLGEDFKKVGASNSQMKQFLSVFAYDPALPKRLSIGDRFEIIYEVWEDERGQKIETGDLVFAALRGEEIDRGFYRYTPQDNGVTDFFDADGDSAEQFLLRKPIPGAPISSRFGRRIHPIRGHSQIHKGVDLSAPRNTRIYAAGDGVVEKMGRNGGYGRQIVIRHANGYKTTYAHMSGYSRDLSVGSEVQQGDLVGFVGSTGHSTGPHLHYEVIRNGLHLDPMKLQLPTGRKLAAQPAVLSDFNTYRKSIDRIRNELGNGTQVADMRGSGTLLRAMRSEAP